MRWNVYKRFRNGLANALSIAVATVFMAGCSDIDVAGGASGDAGVVAIKDREIAGVTQKGPFLTGSSLTLQELDGATLTQTGKSFKALIRSNQGDFAIKGVSLVSQYALLEVEGYFRNEVTGQNSDGMIQLNALTDLRKRNRVNVNLLTHLESGRILNLVHKQGLSVNAAKKQADQELLLSFSFMNGTATPEDMDIFSEKNDGAMLLAVSVLMLQDSSSEADFSERLSMAYLAFAENGSWSGADRAKIADWAMRSEIAKDSSLSVLQRVRKNLESWNEVVPPFENYINLFWSNEYRLGTCSDENLHEVRPNLNENSLYYLDEFVCNSNHHWSLTAYRENADDINIAGVTWAPRNVGCESQKYVTFGGYNDSEIASMIDKQCVVYGGYFFGVEAARGESDKGLPICPEGYRLPTREEAQALIDAYGGAENAAAGLRSVDGFAAVMGGRVNSFAWETPYTDFHKMAGFWTSTARTWFASAFNVYITDYYYLKIDSNGASIDSSNIQYNSSLKITARCVKDLKKGE